MDETLEQLNVSNQIEALRLSCIAGGLIDIDWTHLRTFQNLRHLELIHIFSSPDDELLFDFLRQDRLEFLQIDTQCFSDEEMEKFFSALSNCKKMKFLNFCNSQYQNPILPECIETLNFVGVCRSRDLSLAGLMAYGAGVRFLSISLHQCLGFFKMDLSLPDLKKYFPKLERAKSKRFKATEDLDFYFTRDEEEPLCDYFVLNAGEY